LWVLAILAAPIAADSSHRALSLSAAVVYAAGSNVCHQRPERSFRIAGHKMPVCARCTGLYLSAAAALPVAVLLAVPLTARGARWILLLAALPTAITWGLEYAGVMAFGNVTRALAAVPLGCAAVWLVVTQCRIERSNE
jgi:uncharacterized membrane protein